MTLYEALGVGTDASTAAIGQVYQRLVAEFLKDETAPDPRRQALIRQAWETLSDPQRRAQYDATIQAHKSERTEQGAKRIAVFALAGVAVLAIAVFLFTRKPSPAPPPPPRAAQEILADASRAIGRVRSIEMSGGATPLGLAFSVGGRMMATTCHGMVANSALVVTVEKGEIAARLSIADEQLGICKIVVDASGAVPLVIATAEPRVGDKVYAPGVNAAGQVTLAEGSVKAIVAQPGRRLIELSMPAPVENGAPVLDTQAKVVAVVTRAHDYGPGRTLALPAALVDQAQSRGKAP